MKLSARNGLTGKVTDIVKGQVMAKVKVRLSDNQMITSLISVEAVDDLGLKVGDDVTAIIKATEVMLAR